MAKRLSLCNYEPKVFQELSELGITCDGAQRMPSPYTGNVVLKLTGNQGYLKIYVNELRFHRETGSLTLLNQTDLRGVPRLSHSGFIEAQEPDADPDDMIDKVRYAVFSEIDGTPLNDLFDSMEEEARKIVLAETGRFLRTMFEASQAVSPRHFGEITSSINQDFRADSWQELISKTAERSNRALKCITDASERELFQWMRAYYMGESESTSHLPVGICHRDVTPQNLIVQKNTDGDYVFAGLVDFEQAILGPPGLDLAKLLCLFDLSNACLDALSQAYWSEWKQPLDSASGKKLEEDHKSYLYFTTWFYLLEYPSDTDDERRLLRLCKERLREFQNQRYR